MKKAVFFDMNETLLNLSVLQKSFDNYFDDKHVLKYWFTKLLHTSTVVGAMGEYKNFAKLSEVVLESLFYENGIQFTPKIKDEILGSFRNLPPYNDVVEALKLLQKNKIRTIAVSNSSLEMIKEQLSNTGIINLFDSYYSVDTVEQYKPFRDIYLYVAKEEKIGLEEIVMVATHDWDLYGAKKVGLTTAYIERKKVIYNPYYLQPDISDSNIVELTKKILKL
ncbi:MAG: haloacid dehalogenase type II [Bacteroidaceae bacterium]